VSDELKQCKVCKEFVKSDAAKCRYCHSMLLSFFNPKNPMLRGLFVGLGIWFVFVLIVLTITRQFEPKKLESKEFNLQESGLVVLNDKIVQREANVGIVAELKNGGKNSWSSVDVKAKLLKKDGSVSDLLEKNVRNIRPGETKYFKLTSCCGDKSEPVEFEKYEIYVEDAKALFDLKR
jgi:hypothetical protein